jgi:Fic family protein
MEILEKKIGEQKYFYLRHHLRKNKRVIVKERYLGKKVPDNVRDIEADFWKEIQRELYKKLEMIKSNWQTEWKRYPESMKEKLKEEISIAFTYNTNAIEGSTITLGEAREIIHDKVSPNKPIREVRETEAHSKVFLQMLDIKEKITRELLLRWHFEIFGETKEDIAGKFRDYPVKVGEHRAPDWQDIEDMTARLIEFISTEKMNAVELSARVHYRFEKIHPFGDGNGRVGRLLMNHILWHASYPMLIIEYKKRRSYYKALQKDEESFVNYFIRRYLSVHNKRMSN